MVSLHNFAGCVVDSFRGSLQNVHVRICCAVFPGCMVAASSSSPDQGVQHMQNIPSEEWDRFCHLLEYWCDVMGQVQQGQCKQQKQQLQQEQDRTWSISCKNLEGSLEQELACFNKDIEDTQVECQQIVKSHILREQLLPFIMQLPSHMQQKTLRTVIVMMVVCVVK